MRISTITFIFNGQKAPRPRRPSVQAVAAGAGINQFAMALPGMPCRSQRTGNVLPRAAAGIGHAAFHKLIERLLVQRAALRLADWRLVGHQSAGGQLLDDHLVSAWNAARRVHVLDAHQPLATVDAGIKPAGQRGDEGARMQRAGRGWRKSSNVGPHAPHCVWFAAPRGGRCACGPAKPVPRPLLRGRGRSCAAFTGLHAVRLDSSKNRQRHFQS